MFIDIHVLQYIPLSCINRDDAGMPKTVTVSGVSRARWSAYSQKHVLRDRLRTLLPKGSTSIRTRRLPQLVLDELATSGMTKAQLKAASKQLHAALIKGRNDNSAAPGEKDDAESKDGEDTALLTSESWTIQETSAREIADAMLAGTTAAKALYEAAKDIVTKPVRLDVAMNGRFIAKFDSRTDGAMSVAHAVGTSPDGYVSEFWTSVDDLAGDQGHGGSAVMGSQGLTSGVLYRYATIDLDELDDRMDEVGDVGVTREELLRLTISEFSRLRPEAMKRSSAPFTEPSLVQLDVTDAPRSLIDAYTRPVHGSDTIADSITRLIGHADTMSHLYGEPAFSRRVSTQDPKSIPFATALEDTLAHVAGEGSR